MPTLRTDLAHAWRVSRLQAAEIQRVLAPRVELRALPTDGPGSPLIAAGVDVAYAKTGPAAWAAAVAMDRHFKVVSACVIEGEPDAEYAPGYLAFREGRLSIEALLATPTW